MTSSRKLVQASKHSLLRSERIAGGILPKVLTSFDLVTIFIVITLFVTNVSSIVQNGPVVYLYWGLGIISFFIPGAIATAQLGLLFPGEGSIYIWTTKAFGDFLGFLIGFCAWWPVIFSLVVTASNAVLFIQKFGLLFHVQILEDPGAQGLFVLLIIIISFLLSILRFRITQNMVRVICVLYLVAIVLIGLAGLLWLSQGHAPGSDFSWNAENWLPRPGNFSAYGVVVLAFLGVEVPLNLGVEIRNTRSITRFLRWGVLAIILGYFLATFGIMVAAPRGQYNMTIMVDAIQNGFGPAGTVLAALATLIFAAFFICAAAVYNYAFGRLIFVSGLDRRLPAVVSKVNANKVPWVAALLQSTLAAFFAIVIFLFIPLFTPAKNIVAIAGDVYQVLSAALTVYWIISTIFIFINLLVIRQKYRTTFNSVRIIPDWVLYLCALVGISSGIWGFVVIFTQSWSPDISLPAWILWIVALSFVALLIAIAVFYVGQRTLQDQLSDEAIIIEVTR